MSDGGREHTLNPLTEKTELITILLSAMLTMNGCKLRNTVPDASAETENPQETEAVTGKQKIQKKPQNRRWIKQDRRTVPEIYVRSVHVENWNMKQIVPRSIPFVLQID